VVERYRQHIASLAQRMGVSIRWGKPGQGSANGYASWITIPPIEDEGSYAIALHELGHIQRPCRVEHPLFRACYDNEIAFMADGRIIPGAYVCMTCEHAAWSWAQTQALGGWTDAMEAAMVRSLGFYAVMMGDRSGQ
jgi:hypothetical protein